MDNMTGLQPITFGDLCIPRIAPAESSTLSEQFWTGSAVNGPVNTTAPQQRTICCIHDGIRIHPGDVSL